MISIGKSIIFFGIILIIVGSFILFSVKIPFLGKLFGDINLKKENFQFYFPITTSIVLSIIVSVVFWLMSYFKK